MLQRHLLLWLILSSALALAWPSLRAAVQTDEVKAKDDSTGAPFDPFLVQNKDSNQPSPRFSLGLIVGITMFAIGTLLPRDEVSQVLKQWPTVLGGTVVQYTAMPMLAFGLATAFRLPRELFIGTVLVGCVPGAMASNVLTLAAGGNVSYSVSLTTLATLVSPIVVPVALRLALHTQATVDSWRISQQLLQEVVGPVIAGHLVCRMWGRQADRLRLMAGPIANLAILWIIATVVALNRERLLQTPFNVFWVLLLLNLGGFTAGYGGSKLLSLSEGKRRALTLEVGMQNAGVGTALALKWFADQPSSAIPTAVYTFGCMLTGTMLARWFASRPALSAPVTATSATP